MFKSLTKFAGLAALALAIGAGAASAQTDTSYFVGAIPKAAVAALGANPAVTTVAASGTSQALAAPTYGDAAYDITLTGNCTFTLSGFTAGVRQSILVTLRQDATAGRTVTWPAAVKWSNGATPTYITTAGTMMNITLTSTDGGTTIVAK